MRVRVPEPAIPMRQLKTTIENIMAQDGDGNGDGGETPDTVAQYIASMTGELAQLARRSGLETLCYILEMARIEADQNAKG